MTGKILKQMTELEKEIAGLFQKVRPTLDELNQAKETVETARSELVNLILGPSFFGNEEFFRNYKIINHCGTGRQCYGINRRGFDRTYFCREEETRQILLRVNYELFNKGHYHTALVRHMDEGNIDVYEAAVPIGKFGVPNPCSRWEVGLEWITEHMDKYTVDELVEYNPKYTRQMTYTSFIHLIVGATGLLLEESAKDTKRAKELYKPVERNLKKLQAVANMEAG